MLRTLGGKNIGKCRLRAHQHPLSPPLPNLRQAHPHVKHPRQDASSTRDERVLGWVLGDVLEMGCFLQRFLISSPNFGIDASFSPFTPSFVHRFLISGPDLRIDVSFSPFKPSCVHRFLISGGQFGNRCRVLPVYTLLRAVILDFRPRLANRCKGRMVSPAAVVAATIFRVRFYSS